MSLAFEPNENDDFELIPASVQYFSMHNEKQIISIPFSFSCIVTLEGNFIDDFAKTKKICKEAIADGEAYEIENCTKFLDSIKTVGMV